MRCAISYPPLLCFLKGRRVSGGLNAVCVTRDRSARFAPKRAVASFCPLQGSCDVCRTKIFCGSPHFAHGFGRVERARQTFWTVSSIWNRALALLVLHLVLKSMMPASDHALRSERRHTHTHTQTVHVYHPSPGLFTRAFNLLCCRLRSPPPFDSELCHPWIFR